MSIILSKTVSKMNRIRRGAILLDLSFRLIRAILLGGIVLSLWSMVAPSQEGYQFILAGIAFIMGIFFNSKQYTWDIDAKHLLTNLELKYEDSQFSPLQLKQKHPSPLVVKEWAEILELEIKDFFRFEMNRLAKLGSTLVLPAIVFTMASTFSKGAIQNALSKVSDVVAQMDNGATLTVLDGIPIEGGDKGPFRLVKGKTLELSLLSQNMIEIEVVESDTKNPPRIDLKKRIPSKKAPDPSNEVFQSFRLYRVKDQPANRKGAIYRIAFTVTDDVEIYLSSFSTEKPVVEATVQQLPVPKVRLELTTDLEIPWSDDKPLPLRIDVRAENPLKSVRLVIRSGGQVSTELVTNVVVLDKTELSTNYELILESYLQKDVDNIEIVAEAVDRAIPLPLIGRSPPLVVETVSAYGRYRKTLQTLSEIKSNIDNSLKDRNIKLDENVIELADSVAKQAEDSPFFDGLDRYHLNYFTRIIKELYVSQNMARMLAFSEELNDFLFEHEILDDRERDRDFFVAARALSRVLEKNKSERNVDVEIVIKRLDNFLNERFSRWQLRIKRIPSKFKPKLWAKIVRRPFVKAMSQINKNEKIAKPNSSKSLTILSKSVSSYREWIEALEASEDKARSNMESKRQQGLADARKMLRDLQRRQDGISKKLDKADLKPAEQLKRDWPVVRMDQNSNIKGARRLEAKLRSLSPIAGMRIRAAVDSMKLTLKSGANKDFVHAESAADLAGRLLRQAQSDTRKSQKKQRRRGRRRRITGDRYFGSQVVGGDVEIRHEYEVNKRYRQDILDDVRAHKRQLDGQDDDLLERYLRKVIR